MKELYIGHIPTTLINVQRIHPHVVVKSFVTVDEFKDFYSSMYKVQLGCPLIISDLSMLDFRMAYALKFIEEFTGDLIVLASRDNILPTILSRFDRVHKMRQDESNVSLDPEYLKSNLLSDFSYIDDEKARRTIEQSFPTFMPFYLQTQKVKARRSVLMLAMELADRV